MKSEIEDLSKEDYVMLHEELNADWDFTFDGTVREFKVPARDVPGMILL